MRHRNILIALVVLLAAVGASVAYALLRPGPPAAAIQVEPGTLRSYVEERARTTLPTLVRVTMPFAGRIQPITLVPGTQVAAGDLLAQAETADLEDELAAAKAELAAVAARRAVLADNALANTALQEFQGWIVAMAKLEASAKALITANQAHAAFSDWWEQAEAKLKDQGAVADEKYRRAKTERSEAEVDLAVARMNHQLVQVIQTIVALGPRYVQDYLDHKQLQAVVLDSERKVAAARVAMAERQLARARIEAPIDGVVLERLIESERELAAGTELLTLGDPSTLRVTTDLLSEDAGRVRAGDAVEVYGPVLGEQVLKAQVARVDPRGFTKVSSLGVEQQRVAVIITLAEGELATLKQAGVDLGVAYRVHVRVFTDSVDQALAVPRMALVRSEAGQRRWSFYRVVDGRATLTPVALGIGDPHRVQITDGLKAGDIVLTSPSTTLTAGSKVTPQLNSG